MLSIANVSLNLLHCQHCKTVFDTELNIFLSKYWPPFNQDFYPHLFILLKRNLLPPQVIFSACEQGVFDLLLQSQKPLSAAEVARELGTSEDGMERLLDALVGVEVLEVELTQGTGTCTSRESNTVHRCVYCRCS